MNRAWSGYSIVLAAAALVAACTAPLEPVPVTPPADVAGAPVVRQPIAEPAAVPPPATDARVTRVAPAERVAAPPIVVPPDTQYVCVTESNGVRQQIAIAFDPKVAQLCRRHPEMGPCQYERNLCRASGGRVYAAGGVEITLDTEAEYDRRVTRVRFKAN